MQYISCHTSYHQNWIFITPIATPFQSSYYPYIQNIWASKIVFRSYFYGSNFFKNRKVNLLKLSALIIWSSFWFSTWIIGSRINILCHLVFVLTHIIYSTIWYLCWHMGFFDAWTRFQDLILKRSWILDPVTHAIHLSNSTGICHW